MGKARRKLIKWTKVHTPPTSDSLPPTRSSKGSPPKLAPTPAKKRKHFKSLGLKKHAMETAPRKDKTVTKAAAAAKAKAKAKLTQHKKNLAAMVHQSWGSMVAGMTADKRCSLCNGVFEGHVVHGVPDDEDECASCRYVRVCSKARSLPLRICITFPCGIRCGMSEIPCGVPSPMRGCMREPGSRIES